MTILPPAPPSASGYLVGEGPPHIWPVRDLELNLADTMAVAGIVLERHDHEARLFRSSRLGPIDIQDLQMS